MFYAFSALCSSFPVLIAKNEKKNHLKMEINAAIANNHIKYSFRLQISFESIGRFVRLWSVPSLCSSHRLVKCSLLDASMTHKKWSTKMNKRQTDGKISQSIYLFTASYSIRITHSAIRLESVVAAKVCIYNKMLTKRFYSLSPSLFLCLSFPLDPKLITFIHNLQ